MLNKKTTHKLALSALATAVMAASSAASAGLIFSEYVEGSGTDNKAFELYNSGSTKINLADYKVVKFTNGDKTKETVLTLTGELEAGKTYVVAVNKDIEGVTPDTTNSVANFSGDDPLQIQLVSDNSVVDTLGVFGDVDFGKDKVLSRKTDGLTPATEYDATQWETKDKTDVLGFGFKPGEQGTGPQIPDFVDCGASTLRISAVQGNSAESPEKGNYVQVEGVVTRTLYNQYYIEQVRGSGDAEGTSVAVRVYDAKNKPAVGDRVTVQGKVEERYDVTQLTDVKDGRYKQCATGQTVPQTTVNMPADGNFEALESMNVVLNPMSGDGNGDGKNDEAFFVTEMYNLNRYADLVVSSGSNLHKPTNKNPAGSQAAIDEQARNDKNKLIIDDGDSRQYLAKISYLPDLDSQHPVRVGDRIDSGMEGIISQGFGSYRLIPAGNITVDSSAHPRVENPASPASGLLRVGSFNVLNYFNGFRNEDGTIDWAKSDKGNSRGANTEAEFKRQSSKIVTALARMEADVVGILEMENDGWDDTSAIHNLVTELNASSEKATGKDYAFVQTTEKFIGSDVIKVSIIYNKAAVEPVGNPVILTEYPFDETTAKHRPPMIQTFKQKSDNKEITVVINHFKSKGSNCNSLADPEDKFGQGNCNRQRVAAAETLGKFLQQEHANDDVLIIGDLNAYAKEDPVLVLTQDDSNRAIEKSVRDDSNVYSAVATDYHLGYTNLAGTNPTSYVYGGETGALDHAIGSPSLAGKVKKVYDWSINAMELRGQDYNDEFYRSRDGKTVDLKTTEDGSREWFAKLVDANSPFRSSDHDPVLIDVDLSSEPTPPTPTPPSSGGSDGGSFGFPMLALGLMSLLGLRRKKR
ncbi:ExeM/NucH family extracellular endonuclease [Spongorhabdus nitratireducens]